MVLNLTYDLQNGLLLVALKEEVDAIVHAVWNKPVYSEEIVKSNTYQSATTERLGRKNK